MSKVESVGIFSLFAAVFLFFGAIAYYVHAENMACIKAGGSMKDRACTFPAKEKSHD